MNSLNIFFDLRSRFIVNGKTKISFVDGKCNLQNDFMKFWNVFQNTFLKFLKF